jgi:cytochrome c-type biogenesis protein CcmH/NrfG
MIALSIAADPMKTSNKEDLATTKQTKTELTRRQYHYQTYQSQLTPQNKENNPSPQKKSKKQTATSHPRQELLLDDGDESMFFVGYANVATTTKLH